MEYKVIENIADLNCTNCLNVKKVSDGFMCCYTRNLDEWQFVDESDFCQECGCWLVQDGNDDTKFVSHDEGVRFFTNLTCNVGGQREEI